MLRRVLLSCGIAASALYVGVDWLVALVHPDYHSFFTRWVSELMARGAPSESLVDPLFLSYGVLMIAFGTGLWATDKRRRARWVAGLTIVYAALGLLGPTVFEMDVRGSTGGPPTPADQLHIALTSIMVLLILAQVGVGSTLRGPSFRNYSYATLVVMIFFGILTSYMAQADGSPPWTRFSGLTERINIGAFLVWVVVLAIAVLRGLPPRRRRSARPDSPRPGKTAMLTGGVRTQT